MIKPSTPKARPFKTKVISKFDDQIRKQRIEKEENDQNPFQKCVDKNKSDPVCVFMQHGCKFVGCH